MNHPNYPARGIPVCEYIITERPEQERDGFVPVVGICASFQMLREGQGCSVLLKRVPERTELAMTEDSERG